MASSVTAELLKQLSAASEALNSASDQFNQQINSIEQALSSYNLGVSAWVTAVSKNEEEYDEGGTLIDKYTRDIMVGYQKHGTTWCLTAGLSIPDHSYWKDWVLKDAPRDIRLQAIDGIPKLLEKLILAAEQLTKENSQKVTDARVLASSIKPKKGQ
jgi:hypothetical protein